MIIIEEKYKKLRTNDTNRRVKRRESNSDVICLRNANYPTHREFTLLINFASQMDKATLAETCLIYKKIGNSNYKDFRIKSSTRLQHVSEDSRTTHDEILSTLQVVGMMHRISAKNNEHQQQINISE